MPPLAPRGSAIPIAPAAARRTLPASWLEDLLGVPPGTIASLVGESPEETYAHLQRTAPEVLAKMEALAGGKDRLIAFFNARDTLLPLVDVTGVGPGGSDVLFYNRARQTIQIPMGLDTPSDEVAWFPAVFDRFVYYVGNQQGVLQLLRYDMVQQLVDTLPVANDGHPVAFPSAGLPKRLIAYQEITPAGPRLRLYDAIHNARLIPAAMAGVPCQVPRFDLFEQRIVFGTPGAGGRQVLRIYDLASSTIQTPPFVEGGNASQASFSLDGSQLVYISDRHGSPDIYLTDLRTGFTDDLPLANSAGVEAVPRFIGADELIFLSDRAGRPAYYTYRLDTHLLEPLPVTAWLPPPPGTAETRLEN